MRLPRSIASSALATALVAAGFSSPILSRAAAAERTATLVGSLQSEISSCGDWTPDCTATDLTLVAGTTTYEKVFEVPAGTYVYKVAINHAWDESYGAPGGANSPPKLYRISHAL